MSMRALVGLVALALTATPAVSDPHKDESGKMRERALSLGGNGVPGAWPDHRRPVQARSFKEEFDDGTCKYERKLEKSGEYKEEMKCRSGRASR